MHTGPQRRHVQTSHPDIEMLAQLLMQPARTLLTPIVERQHAYISERRAGVSDTTSAQLGDDDVRQLLVPIVEVLVTIASDVQHGAIAYAIQTSQGVHSLGLVRRYFRVLSAIGIVDRTEARRFFEELYDPVLKHINLLRD